MPGGRAFVSLFRPGARSFELKNCPRGGDFDGKNTGPDVSRGWGEPVKLIPALRIKKHQTSAYGSCS